MKIDRKAKILMAMVSVVFVLFNIIFFLAIDSVGINATTIISWVFMLLGFVSFLTFAYLSKSKGVVPGYVVLRLTLYGHCALYLVVDFILAVFFTILGSFVDILPVWSVSIQLVALVVHVFIALACLMAKAVVEDVGVQVKQKTSRMKSFRVESEMLVEYCTDAAAKNDFRKFAEAIRYSDPMSCDALTDIEDDLEQIISEMKNNLMSGKIEIAQDKCKIANNILKERNKKCQMFK